MGELVTIQELLAIAAEHRASDLHLTMGVPPYMRVHGDIVAIANAAPLQAEDIDAIVTPVLSEKHAAVFRDKGEVDFAFGLPGGGRFRCNLFKQRGASTIVIRLINSKILAIEDLGLPDVLHDFCRKNSGLVLVTGPTGSGKSTTLAAMIDLINSERKGVIITMEDPLEYLHTHKQCLVNQREIGSDSHSFPEALRAALRADPDVILVGEMRDLETIATAITAAETGHLVFSTLHTRSAAQTIDRVIDAFPPTNQQQIRIQLSSVLEGVVSQQLIRRHDGQGMACAVEVMVGTPAIRNMIRDGKTHQIPSVIETSARYGMRTLDAALQQLVNQGLISPSEADVRRH